MSLAISTLALTPPVEARPQQPSLGICDFDELADVANLGDAGSALAVVADAGANRMFILGAGGCDDFPLMDGGNPAEFNGPRGVTADPDGRIYVADTGNDRIMRFEGVAGLNSTDGVNLLDVFDGSTVGLNLDAPEGLGADDDGLIYIANTGAGRVRIIDSAGFSQGLIGSPDDGDDETDGEFLEPADVAVCTSEAPDPYAGRIFVVDRGRDNVQVFDSEGDFLFDFGEEGSAPGELQSPSGVDVDHLCNVYIADAGNDRMQLFDADGGFLEIIGQLSDASGVAVSPTTGFQGGVFASSPTSDELRNFVFIDYDIDGNGNGDDDGDALPDIWEVEGIDLDFDGDPELDLPAMGADPAHKTLFVEVDYLSFHEPSDDVLDTVAEVFASAPVENPDGQPGIDLLVTVDDEIDETANRIDIATWGEYDAIKKAFFGTEADRTAPNADDRLLARQLAFRYALFGHIRDGGGSSGRAKGGGNFLVTLGAPGWGSDPASGHKVGNFKEQTGTFMHELGHTLSLGHGGRGGPNYKPNYVSVMSYNYQTTWIPSNVSTDVRLDYSNQRLPTFDGGALDEADLDETAGLGLGDVAFPDDLIRWGPPSGLINFDAASNAIDWDGMNGPVDVGTNSDLNGDGDEDELLGHDDWAFLSSTPKAFNFRVSPGFAGVGRAFEEEEQELTDQEAQEIAEFWHRAKQPRYVYSAKFLCVPLVGPEGTALSPGRYQTVINIHNPSTEEVRLLKKVVIARNELEERGPITPLEDDSLGDDEAISIDCTSIASRFDEPQPVGDGFVVIKSDALLDVVAVYTTRDSVDVETIEPTDFDPPKEEEEPEDRADLTIRLPSPTRVNCSNGQGSCVHSVEVEIENLGPVDVTDPFDVVVKLDIGLSATETVSSLAAGDTQTFIVKTAAGGNCYAPNCSVEAVVDDGNAIPESDESNNTDSRLDLG